MINYDYLSCTDYDGTTKQINFVSENFPATISETFDILVVCTDSENDKLLHVKKLSSDTYLKKTDAEEDYLKKTDISLYQNTVCLAGVTQYNEADFDIEFDIEVYFQYMSKNQPREIAPESETLYNLMDAILASLELNSVSFNLTGLIKVHYSSEDITTIGIPTFIQVNNANAWTLAFRDLAGRGKILHLTSENTQLGTNTTISTIKII